MSLHAIGDVDDAIDATKAFLFPFEVGKWLRLALVVFFLGGGVGGVQNVNSFSNFANDSGPTGPGGTGGPSQVPDPSQFPATASEALTNAELLMIIIVVAALLVVGLLFAFLGALMEYVFAQSLIDTEVHVRRSIRAHFGNGIRLLVFRIGVGLATLLVFGGILAGALYLLTGGSLSNLGPATVLGSAGLLVVVFVVATILSGTVNGFTNVFVVPLMIAGDHGVLAGWRRLLDSIRAEPKQYLAYLVFSVVLAIGVNIVGSVLGVIAFIVLLIPFGILGAITWFGLGGGLLAGVVTGIIALAFVLALLLVANLIKAPLQTFLRYYAMLVLGDIDDALDPLPEVRDSIRT